MDEKRRRFEAMMVPHLDAAHSLARWLTRSDSDADDVVQEAYLRAWRSFEGFRGGDARPWLFTILRNCHYTEAARRKPGATVPLAEEGDDAVAGGPILVSDEADPEMALDRAQTGAALERLMAELPVEFREVLVLREFEDLTYRDISTVVGVPIGTVMSRLARARAQLRRRWMAEHGGAAGAADDKVDDGVR